TATAQFLPLFGGIVSIDGSVSFSETPIDRIPMPPFLSNVAGSYAILITDESMRPEFRIEDIALVNPHLPPVPDKPCLFRSALSGGTGCVRVLIRETGTHWVVGRHNPVGQDKLPKATWPHCHRIVGRYNR
ncbi:helix-turn-helix transcriptional regulator, partial [Rhodoplanes sp. SY1]|uniref:S24 family peptidase n=1 Tax=Rhodoplanes sp. SY1 TaxID=3166646 RepID=UPI0038B5E8D4